MTRVDVSTRLTDSPAALVQSAYGMSPQMQKYYRAQASMSPTEQESIDGQFNQAILELNPSHPIVQSLKEKVATAPDAIDTMELGKLVYDVAALAGGYDVEDPGAFSARITKLMSKQALGEDAVLPVEEGLSTRDMEDLAPAVTPDVVNDDAVEVLRTASQVDDVLDEST